MSKVKVVFLGFSVTRYGNPCYPVRLNQMLSEDLDNIHDVSFAALGGVSIECVPFVMDHLKKLMPDLIVFEIGTSHYSTTDRDIERTKEILKNIVIESVGFCKQIDFLLLPRKDVSPNCTIAAGLHQLQKEYSFGLIDLRAIFDGHWELYANDFVHPSEMGVNLISERLKKELKKEIKLIYLLSLPLINVANWL